MHRPEPLAGHPDSAMQRIRRQLVKRFFIFLLLAFFDIFLFLNTGPVQMPVPTLAEQAQGQETETVSFH